MGRSCIKKDADQDIQRNEEALYTKKRLQKVHVTSRSLGGRSSSVPTTVPAV